ncbi:zinc finger MYM-type protein 1-like [Diabrotica virgifera virgifera]|uniref:Zinc finger MYM-type protein 1-like n=1 Tax=Diabrotica virgifera virgifera TaxID=50390 RepID=A0ABM5L1D9_DIAVI|nr:zinc finger MYM-type protein 1-like [Diabrotica virgifera virgifera]
MGLENVVVQFHHQQQVTAADRLNEEERSRYAGVVPTVQPPQGRRRIIELHNDRDFPIGTRERQLPFPLVELHREYSEQNLFDLDEAEREDEVQPEPSSSKLDCQIINIQDEDEVMLELETGNIEDKSKEDRKIGPSAGKSTYTVLDIERDHDAEVIASLLGKENPTDKGHFEKINLSTTLKTFIVLEKLFDISLTLAKNSLAFRDSQEHNGNYEGNFLSLVQLSAKYDTVMAQVVSMPKGHTRYLSHDIQNQIINCMSSKLKGKLLENINKARFFSLIVDTTQDLGKKDQLSFVIRYTNFFEELRQDEDGNFEEYKKLSIEESFLGFFHVKDATALGLSTQVVDCLQNLGVQKRLQEIEKLAVYVHCNAHNLNLAINDAVKEVRAVDSYFTTLQSLYVFFGLGIKRWDILSSLTGESEVTLKKLNPTRWASRHDSILAVKVRYLDIMKALTKIILESNKQEEVSEAKALAKSLDNFQFVMLTVVLSKIFTQLNITSKFLQGKETDLEKAARVLERSQTELKKMREDYEAYKDEATLIARKWNVQPMFSQSRQRKGKRHFDELADFRFSSGEEAFRVQVFYAVLDIVNRQIEDRFSSVRDVVQLFSVLFPTVLVKLTEKEIFEKAGELQRVYEKDIGPSLPLELISLQSGFKCELSKLKTVYDLASLLMIEFDTLATSFPEVQTALMLFLTLPVTVASAERSFSVLKRIKCYLRTSMGQDRLSDLGMLAINQREASQLDKRTLVQCFAEMKFRRKVFAV